MSYSDIDLGFCGVHLKTISQEAPNSKHELENYLFKFIPISPSGQWVKKAYYKKHGEST